MGDGEGLRLVSNRLSFSEQISACKWQGWKPTLNAYDIYPSSSTTLKTNMILYGFLGIWLHWVRNTLENLCIGEHSLRRLYHAKEKRYINNFKKCRQLLLAKAHVMYCCLAHCSYQINKQTFNRLKIKYCILYTLLSENIPSHVG